MLQVIARRPHEADCLPRDHVTVLGLCSRVEKPGTAKTALRVVGYRERTR